MIRLGVIRLCGGGSLWRLRGGPLPAGLRVSSGLQAASDRLNRLALYPRPVDTSRVRVVHAPWFFRIPGFRRCRGYALWRTILIRHEASPDLLCHELCHIWQVQHRPLASMVAWLVYSYRRNPFEREARAAVTATRFEVK